LKKVLIVHPVFLWGGSETVLINMIEALKANYEVYVISTSSLYKKISEIKQKYNTSLSKNDFKEINIYSFAQKKPKLAKHLLMRWIKKNNKGFDILISNAGFMDFGKKGIQYIHYPPHKSNYGKVSIRTLIKSYIVDKISNFDEKSRVQNFSICNSNWTKKELINKYKLNNIEVIYPPVYLNKPKRKIENSFIAIGRISPEKKIEKIIYILDKVKASISDVSLLIVGSTINTTDKKYIDFIKSLVSNRDYIDIVENPSYTELQELMSKTDFGIHAMPAEHFGIAIVEMMSSGCIVFAPNDGGQAEIINDIDLLYNNENECVNKIINIIENNKKEEKREILLEKSHNYSNLSFKNNFLLYIKEKEEFLC
jgi:glycosyltransferase involved in cell wall biosynthesis